MAQFTTSVELTGFIDHSSIFRKKKLSLFQHVIRHMVDTHFWGGALSRTLELGSGTVVLTSCTEYLEMLTILPAI